MVRLRWALAALLLIPLADALFLVYVAGLIGWQVTVLLVVLTALLGMLFVRAEGRHTLRRIQQGLAQGKPPTNEIIDGGLLIAAGAFLLTPGLVTDTLGLIFVIPLTRVPIRTVLKRYVITPYLDKQTGGFATGNVYTFGFPNNGQQGPGQGQGPGWTPTGGGQGDQQADQGQSGFGAQGGSPDEDIFDLGSDAYDVEFDEDEGDEDRSHDAS